MSLILTAAASIPSAYCESPWRGEPSYGERVRGKFLFGVANIYGGWISLFYEPELAAKDNKNIALGVGKGFLKAAANTAGGFAHFLTFPLTFIDIPLPDNGVDM